MKILGLIPARGGSKGIPRKNLAMLCGKPLIQWTIEAAVESGCFHNLCISTDAMELWQHFASAMLDADPQRYSIHKRAPELATDESPVIDTVFAVLEQWHADAVFLLQPTNPLRTAEDIQQACSMLEAGAESVVSYSPVGEMHPARMRRLIGTVDESETLILPWNKGEGFPDLPRQELEDCFIRDGSVYLATTEHLKEHGRFETSPETQPLIIPRERSVRIDEPFDLEYAEFLLTRQQKLVSNT